MPYEKNTFLTALLRRLPSRWHAALDAWSYRVAKEHAQRRRAASKRADTGKIRGVAKP